MVNGTWDLVDLLPSKKVVGSRWAYKVKLYEMGEVARFKARIVAPDYTQRYGVDFDEGFASVSTLRRLLTLA